MSKPLTLDDAGNLKLAESQVSEQINDLLRAHGWECIRTPATKVKYPSGQWGWIFEEGHADWLCVRPVRTGLVEMFYREDKARKGKTSAERRAKQHAWAEERRHHGYLVCSIPHDVDGLEWFKLWYWTNFSEGA
jgi:hypothetical protein